MTLIKKIVYNTVVSAGARIIGVALSLISIGLIARYLGKEGFGSYSLVLAFLYTFNILADLGLYSLMTREISRSGANEEKIASNIFTIRLVSLVFFLGLAILIVWFFPYSFQIKLGVAIGSIAYFLMSATQVLMGIFQKRLRIDKPSLAEFIGRLVQLFLIVLFIFLDLGFFVILFALIISTLVIFVINWLFARSYIKLSLDFDFLLWKKLLKAAFPIAASIVLTLIYFKLDTIFLSLGSINRFSENPIIDVGIYNVAYKVLEGLIFFPAMFVGLMMPFLSRFAFSNQDNFKKIFQKTLDVLIIFIVPLIIAILILSLPIVVLIGGDEFSASAKPLQILSIAVGLIFLGTLFGHSIIALDKQKAGAWIYLGGMVFNVVANLIFIPKYSYVGAAMTTVFTELLVTILMIGLIYKTIHYFPSFKRGFKAVLAGIIMGVFVYFFQEWNLFILIVLGIVIYFAALFLFKGITKKEILLLIKSRV